jgi:hypothetical protein
MKSLVLRILTSLLLGVLILGPMAQAQRIENIIKVNIPFDFGVGDRVFPAGNYSVVSTAPALLDLRNEAGHILIRVLTNSVEATQTPASPTLQFNSEGGRYALAQVWQENNSIGQQLQPPKSWPKSAKRQNSRTLTVAVSNSQ